MGVKLSEMTIDVWMQHPTKRFLAHDMFDSLRRWTGDAIPEEPPPIDVTVAAMDAAGVALRPAQRVARARRAADRQRRGRGVDRASTPTASRGSPPSTSTRPMEAVRELRRCVGELGFVGLRVIPWLWEAPPTDRRYYPLYAACVELGVPFCTQVGHTGPLKPSETGRPIPYIDQVAIDFPELTIVCGHIGYPWTEEMVAVARKHERVYIDTSAYTARRYPPELVAYLRTSGGSRKVMFGSNFPMIAPEQALEHLHHLKIDDETQELFLHANAERVFGL